jgi:hypothetical protein
MTFRPSRTACTARRTIPWHPASRVRAGASVLLFAVACACSGSAAPAKQASDPTAARQTGVTAAARHDCPGRRDSSSSPLTVAVRCAEGFVASNGYTGAEPSPDSTQCDREMLDGSPMRAAVAARRHTVQAHAAVVCRDLGLGPVYLVGFRGGSYSGRRSVDRLVMMDTQFRSMRVGHQPTDVDALLRERDCTPVGDRSR